jgi:hypothetical protein
MSPVYHKTVVVQRAATLVSAGPSTEAAMSIQPRHLIVTLPLFAACATGDPNGGSQGDDDPAIDAAVGGPDAPEETPDAAPGAPDAMPDDPDAAPPAAGPAPLLLSEVVLAPTGGELIEIVNPTANAVDLSTYYLTDVPTYFRLPADAQTIDSSDFIARFPAGASIPAGGVVTVAVATTAEFTTAYGVAPTYSIASGTMTVVGVNGTATLTNAGELIALIHWDGTADLVVDVDLLLAGVPTAANGLSAKTGTAVDGPDANATTSAYVTDAGSLPAQASAPASGLSTKRITLEAGHETQNGAGNGVLGHDETSEVTTTTWDATYTAPTPGATTLPLP